MSEKPVRTTRGGRSDRSALYIGSHSGIAAALAAVSRHLDLCGVGPQLWTDGLRRVAAAKETVEMVSEHVELIDALAGAPRRPYDVIVVGGLQRRRPPLIKASSQEEELGIPRMLLDSVIACARETFIFIERRVTGDDLRYARTAMSQFARNAADRTASALKVHALFSNDMNNSDDSRLPLIVNHLLAARCEPGGYGHSTADREFAPLSEPSNASRRPIPEAVRSQLEAAGGRVDRVGISRDGVEIVSTEASATSAISRCRALRGALLGSGYTPVITQDDVESMRQSVESAYLDFASVERQLAVLDEPDPPPGGVDYVVDADDAATEIVIPSYGPTDPCRIVLIPDHHGGALSPLVCAAGPQLAGVRFVAQIKQWHELFGATVLFAGSAMEFDVARPPRNLQVARQLANQHFGTAHNLNDVSSELAYARWLQQSPRWTLWWD